MAALNINTYASTNFVFKSNFDDYSLIAENKNQAKTNSATKTIRYAKNSRTGVVASLTEKIQVRLKNGISASSISRLYGITIDTEFKNIRVVFFTVNSNQNIFDITNLLKNDTNIESAQIDMIKNLYKPN